MFSPSQVAGQAGSVAEAQITARHSCVVQASPGLSFPTCQADADNGQCFWSHKAKCVCAP